MVQLRALALDNEINLNKIAAHFDIKEKYSWEDPLILHAHHLEKAWPSPKNTIIYLFSFGSLVCMDDKLELDQITGLLDYLKKIDPGLNIQSPFTYSDDYEIRVDPTATISVNYDYLVLPAIKDYHLEIIATVLAKSVALERIEDATIALLDKIEGRIDSLEKGRFSISDRNLARIAAKVLRFKYNTISYLMLLDKPEVSWLNEETQEFFEEMNSLFELEDRYQALRHKSEVLMDVTDVLTTLAHAERDSRLEWLIIILIAFEIFLYLMELYRF
ncbi:MAG TPA: RMD1 family protein [Clostridia bacterium]|nr:RMD1 family protein [Clostridia bacterium]